MTVASGPPAAVPGNTPDHREAESAPHVNYPHLPGRLYDCPACEAECHCTPGDAQCIYDGKHNGTAEG